MPLQQPVTRYVETNGHFIACQVFGQDQIDLLIVPCFISYLEHHSDDPDLVAGSSIEFKDRDRYSLKGIPEEWRHYEAIYMKGEVWRK